MTPELDKAEQERVRRLQMEARHAEQNILLGNVLMIGAGVAGVLLVMLLLAGGA